MLSRLALNRFLLRALPGFVGLALLGYFGFHAAYGDRGLLSLRSLESDRLARQAELARLEVRKVNLQRRVNLVSGPEIDGDLLEEEVRILLGWTTVDEIVILAPEAKTNGIN